MKELSNHENALKETKIKAIIFDFDGVILDSVDVKTKAFADMYNKFGKEIELKVVEHHLANGGISRFEKFKLYHLNFLSIELDENEIQELAEQFSEIVFDKIISSPFIPGAKEFLADNYHDYHFFIATGTPQYEIENIVTIMRLKKFFTKVYGSPATKTEIISQILEKYDLNCGDIYFVGDAMTDFEAAKTMKVKFIGVQNKNTIFPKGTTLISDLRELNKWHC